MSDPARWRKQWETVAGHPRTRHLRAKYDRPISFVQRRLSPAADFGLHFTCGVIVMFAACFGFAELAEDIIEKDDITEVDHEVAHYLHQRALPGLTRFIWMVTHAGSGPFLTVMGGILALWLWKQRDWFRLFALLVILPGGSLLNVAIKHVIRRPRPVFEDPIATLETFSFPSAHAMAATHFYGLLAFMIVTAAVRWRFKLISVVMAAVVVVLIAFSRIYLGVHFLSDVLGGIIVGTAWLTFGWFAAEALRIRSRRRRLALPRTPA